MRGDETFATRIWYASKYPPVPALRQPDCYAGSIRRHLQAMSPQKARQEAAAKAAEITRQTGRKYVAREDHGRLSICPMYVPGFEGYLVDAGYSAYGVIVRDSKETP